jgi:hypothetical protein
VAPEHIARSDCERIRPGLVAQPANAASSLAYCAVGAWIWRHADRARTPRPWRFLAVTAAVVGVGSAAYHGPGRMGGRILHDASNAVLLPALAVAVASGGPPPRPRLHAAGGLLAGVGVLAHRLSRSGGPLCRPDSPLQGHALWHLLGAASLLTSTAAHLAPDGSDPTPPSPGMPESADPSDG